VSVVGNAGSGKTTLAGALADAIGAPHLELDSIFHQPNWEPLDVKLFRAQVADFIAGDAWVVDGNYSAVRQLVWARADTVIWLDLPRYRVMAQLTLRTLRRILARAELWNGNTESVRSLFRLDPEQSILRWAWTQHDKYSERYRDAQEDPANVHLNFVRVPTRSAAAKIVASVAAHGGAAGE